MEAWGSWTFSRENENLLDEVLNKFSSDQCNLDEPIKDVLLSLAAPSKTRNEFACSSSSDESDIDGDFNAVLTRSPRFHAATITESEDGPTAMVVVDDEAIVIPATHTFDSESSFLSQPQPAINALGGNSTTLVIELLNAGDYDVRELCSLLKTERRNRKDVSEIIGDVWPEMVTDKARHGLCEALVKTDVKPHVVCEHLYLPWFKACESNLTGFIESLSKLIVHFPDYACKYFLVKLLKDKESILIKHVDWLVEIMKSLDQQHWCSLLSEYMKYCSDNLDHHEIPVLSHLVKNCQKSLTNHTAERLVVLCRNSAHVHSANTDFAAFLVTVIGAIDLTRFRLEITSICGQLKGASKFLAAKALKNAK